MLPDDYNGESTVIPQPHGGALKPFPAGVSGNPAGKPKGAKNRSTLYREWLEMGSHEANVMKALISKASDGDVAAIKEIFDGAYGKITDKQELKGDMNVNWPVPQSNLDE